MARLDALADAIRSRKDAMAEAIGQVIGADDASTDPTDVAIVVHTTAHSDPEAVWKLHAAQRRLADKGVFTVHGLAYGQIRILALVGSLFTAVLIVLILAYDPPGLEPPGRFGHAFGREMLRWAGVFGLCGLCAESLFPQAWHGLHVWHPRPIDRTEVMMTVLDSAIRFSWLSQDVKPEPISCQPAPGPHDQPQQKDCPTSTIAVWMEINVSQIVAQSIYMHDSVLATHEPSVRLLLELETIPTHSSLAGHEHDLLVKTSAPSGSGGVALLSVGVPLASMAKLAVLLKLDHGTDHLPNQSRLSTWARWIPARLFSSRVREWLMWLQTVCIPIASLVWAVWTIYNNFEVVERTVHSIWHGLVGAVSRVLGPRFRHLAGVVEHVMYSIDWVGDHLTWYFHQLVRPVAFMAGPLHAVIGAPLISAAQLAWSIVVLVLSTAMAPIRLAANALAPLLNSRPLRTLGTTINNIGKFNVNKLKNKALKNAVTGVVEAATQIEQTVKNRSPYFSPSTDQDDVAEIRARNRARFEGTPVPFRPDRSKSFKTGPLRQRFSKEV